MVRPFAKRLRERLKIQGVDDLESEAGNRYIGHVGQLLDRLAEAGHDVNTMDREAQQQFSVQVMVAIRDEVQEVSCCERLKYCSFFSSHIITTQKFEQALEQIIEAVIRARSPASAESDTMAAEQEASDHSADETDELVIQ